MPGGGVYSVPVWLAVGVLCSISSVDGYLRRSTTQDIRNNDDTIRGRALNGESGAQFVLAEFSKHGYGVSQDDAVAVEWFTKAANQGHKVHVPLTLELS